MLVSVSDPVNCNVHKRPLAEIDFRRPANSLGQHPLDLLVIVEVALLERINRGLSPNSCDAGSNSERWRKRYAGNPAGFARRVESVLPLIDFDCEPWEITRAGNER